MASKSFWSSSKALPALVLIGGVSYFLLIEHRQHLFQWLPFLIIALCPLMHIFMHGGHGGHGNHEGHNQSGSGPGDPEDAAYRSGLEEGRKQSFHRRNDNGER